MRRDPSRTLASGEATDDFWRGNLANTSTATPLILTLLLLVLLIAIVLLHFEKVSGAGKCFMKHTHQACEHLRRVILVDVQVCVVVKRVGLIENRRKQAAYLFLISLPFLE